MKVTILMLILLSLNTYAADKTTIKVDRKPASGEFDCFPVGEKTSPGLRKVVYNLCDTKLPFSVSLNSESTYTTCCTLR